MKNRAYFGNMGLIFFFTMLLLVSCSTTPAVKYYTLNPLSEMKPDISQGVSRDSIAIGVGPVEFPRFLDRPQIVTRKSQHRVEVSEFHRWAGSFSEDFLQVLAKNISISLDRPVFSDLSYSADHRAVLWPVRGERCVERNLVRMAS
jgi:uncharacterized lipoprotein YmbA